MPCARSASVFVAISVHAVSGARVANPVLAFPERMVTTVFCAFAIIMTSMPASSPPSHFDRAAREWDTRPTSQQLSVVPQRLLRAVPFGADQHWLDFGAGTGLMTVAIAPRVRRVTALDTSTHMLRVLDEKNMANVSTLYANVFAGLPDRYDGITSCMALHHVADTALLLQVFYRHLQPGGRLALVDLYREDGSFHGDNVAKGVWHFGFEPDALQALAQAAGFADARFEEILQLKNNERSYPLFLMQARKP
jgi:ubiquinone/menaquinone biosynthesis C-methylase UbiE